MSTEAATSRPGVVDLFAAAAFALALASANLAGCGADAEPANDAGAVDAVEAVDVAGQLTQTTACAACGGACSEESWNYSNVYHDNGPIHYAEAPPSAGTHHGCWWPEGTFDTAVPTSRFVHNLEHGWLILAYDCPSGCAADVAALEKAGKASGRRTIVTPFKGADARIVAVAWEHRLLLDCVDEAAIVAFAKQWCPLAPEQVDVGPSASCME
jgi:hypothetical protein